MGEYEDTLKDIEKTLGIAPGFMKAIPKDVLIHDWPLMKKYQMGETAIPAKYREFIGLAIAANIKCPYCTHAHGNSNTERSHRQRNGRSGFSSQSNFKMERHASRSAIQLRHILQRSTPDRRIRAEGCQEKVEHDQG